MIKLKKFKVDRSCTREAVSKNISRAVHVGGAPQKQAVAIALNVAKRAGCDLKHLKKKTTKKPVIKKAATKTSCKKTSTKSVRRKTAKKR